MLMSVLLILTAPMRRRAASTLLTRGNAECLQLHGRRHVPLSMATKSSEPVAVRRHASRRRIRKSSADGLLVWASTIFACVHGYRGDADDETTRMRPSFGSCTPHRRRDMLANARDESVHLIVAPLASLWETTLMTLRAFRLLVTFAPLVCLYVPVYLMVPGADRIWWTLLLNAVEYSGPVFIKLGQWASTRRDLFSSDFCDRFARLQRSVKPHSWQFTCRRLDEAFGGTEYANWRQFIVFDELGTSVTVAPIGSGCVAQVYRARLRTDLLVGRIGKMSLSDDGRSAPAPTISGFRNALAEGLENLALRLMSVLHGGHLKPTVEEFRAAHSNCTVNVNDGLSNMLPIAVKVLHPGIHTLFRRDLAIMKTFVDAAETIVPGLHWLNLSRCVEEFASVMKKQIDLQAEARNLDLFARNFNKVSSVRFPAPIHPLVDEHVLVETFEEGEPMLQFTRSCDASISKRLKHQLAEIGIEAVFKMVFADNFVHGDLHPGNILVQNAGQEEEDDVRPPRLVFLDCGITASLEESDVDNMFSVFNAVVLGNGEEVGELFLKHTREHRCSDAMAFKRDMAKIVTDFRQSQRHSKEASVSTVIGQLFATLMRHRVQLEGNFAIVILSMMIIEGLGHSLKPDMDVLAKAKPFLLARLRRKVRAAALQIAASN